MVSSTIYAGLTGDEHRCIVGVTQEEVDHMTEALKSAKTNRDQLIDEDVVSLSTDIPAYRFQGSGEEVIRSISNFEDGFRFVPVQRPAVEGDFYLTNLTGSDGSKHLLPKYTMTSAYYHLLRSSDTLSKLLDVFVDDENTDLEFVAAIQKQISVAIHNKKDTKSQLPHLLYLNSYDRTAREQIILGHLFVGLKYMHRRSGTSKDEVETLAELLKDDDGYNEMVKRMNDYEMDISLFKSFLAFTKVPPRKLYLEFLGGSKETYKEAVEADMEIPLVYSALRNRYANNTLFTLSKFIGFMHALYRYHTSNDRYDQATRFASAASEYMRKKILPHFKIANLI